MKIIDRCCLSSNRDDNDKIHVNEVEYAEIKEDKIPKKRKKLNFLAFLMLDKINQKHEFYSKFYTASCQPRVFCRGKKYKIERKHKIKKRDLHVGANKLSGNAISVSNFNKIKSLETVKKSSNERSKKGKNNEKI